MSTFHKKLAVSFFTLVLVIGAYMPLPFTTPRAQAFFAGGPVVVVADPQRVAERIADALAWTAAKTVVQSLTQSIINWINSGFDGSPAFVSDLDRNLGNLADAVADDFFRQLDDVVEDNTGFTIRAPFQDQINRALREEYYRTTSSYGFNVRYPYRDCYGSGGFNFDGFFCQSQNPANNPWGRYLLARNELWNTIDQETQNRLRELDWGNGFLSWRGSCGPNGQSGDANPVEGDTVGLGQRDENYACAVRTPGTVIEDQLVQSLGSPMRQLELADSVNEILSALMAQLVGQVLGGGGLRGVSQAGYGGGTSYADRLGASMSEGFAQNVAEMRTMLTNAQGGWQRVRDAASVARTACRNDSTESNQADQVFAEANTLLTETNSALLEIDAIEAERVRLANSPTTDSTDIVALTTRLQTLISRTGAIAQGEAAGQDTGAVEPGSPYSQMVRLAESCR